MTGYFIKKAFSGIRNAPLINLIAVLNISLSLFFLGAFYSGYLNAGRLIERLGSRFEVTVYLEDGISSEALSTLERHVRELAEVRDFEYISKDKALTTLQKGLGEDASVLEGLDGNPLPASMAIRLKEEFQNAAGVKNVSERLGKMDYIGDVQHGGKWLERLSLIIAAVKFGGMVLGIVLTASAMLIVSGTIRLTIQMRMEEIEVMRLVGATRLFIKAPYYIEGVVLGIAGASLAIAALAVVNWVARVNYGSGIRFLSGGNIDFLPYQSVIAVFSCGMIFGLMGSIVSLWRFPRT